jgi:anti-sigma factor RsiW
VIRLLRRHRHDPLVCREFVELVTDYLDGALPEAERKRFAAHLGECDGCAGYLADIRSLSATLHDAAPPAPDEATREVLLRAFRDLRG